MWNKKTRRNPTAKLPYAYVPTEDDPLALEPDLGGGMHQMGRAGDVWANLKLSEEFFSE